MHATLPPKGNTTNSSPNTTNTTTTKEILEKTRRAIAEELTGIVQVRKDCVVYTYYEDCSKALQDHFDRSLISIDIKSKSKDLIASWSDRNLPQSFWNANGFHHQHHQSVVPTVVPAAVASTVVSPVASTSASTASVSQQGESPVNGSTHELYSSESLHSHYHTPHPHHTDHTHHQHHTVASSVASTVSQQGGSPVNGGGNHDLYSSDPYQSHYHHAHPHHAHHAHHAHHQHHSHAAVAAAAAAAAAHNHKVATSLHHHHPTIHHHHSNDAATNAAAAASAWSYSYAHHARAASAATMHDFTAAAVGSANRLNHPSAAAQYSSLLLPPPPPPPSATIAAAAAARSRFNQCGGFELTQMTAPEMHHWPSTSRYDFSTHPHAIDANYTATAAYSTATVGYGNEYM